jgi:large conductance mechanosensitive channel
VLQEFKDFALKGDLVTIAVGLVLAIAFTDVVNSLVEHIIMPVVGIIVGERSFETLTWEIGDAVILYGAFITAVLTFVIIAAALFFLVVRPYNELKARMASGEETAVPEPEEIVLLREIAKNTGG